MNYYTARHPFFALTGNSPYDFSLTYNVLRTDEFKCLLIQRNTGYAYMQMLLMSKDMLDKNPIFHAQGLLEYMRKEQLNDIKVFGGGLIFFGDDMDYASVKGFSYTFKGMIEEQVITALLYGIPSLKEINTTEMVPPDPEDLVYHRVYTLAEVQAEVLKLEKESQ